MWCTSCALAVEGTLKRLPGITEVSVHYPTATVWVKGAPEATQLDALAPKVARIGYRLTELEAVQDAHTRLEQESRYLTLRLIIGAVFGMWTMLASLLIYAGALPTAQIESVLAWVSGAFALPVVCYAGLPFYRAGWRTLLAKRPGMDVLVSLGVVGAVVVSVGLLWRGSVEVYFDTAVMLIVLLLMGRLVETLCRQRGLKAFETLALPSSSVTVVQGSQRITLPVEEVGLDALVDVNSGAIIPLDGTLETPGWIDTATLSGESVPRYFTAGQRVYAGCRYVGGSSGAAALTLKVTAPVGQRRVDKLCEQMRRFQAQKGELQTIAERFAAWLSPAALVLALLTWPVALLFGVEWDEASVRALSVLVVACPCAVGLAVPLASLAGSGQAIQQGVALRDPSALEVVAKIRSIAFDKTGTLTAGQHRVLHAILRAGIDEHAFQQQLFVATHQSEHPLASGLRHWANVDGSRQWDSLAQLEETPGAGQHITFVNGEQWWLGNVIWLTQQGMVIPDSAQDDTYSFASQVAIADQHGWLATLYLADQPVNDAATTLQQLNASGYVVAMISGDRQGPVRWLGQQIGLAKEACYAQRSPEAKAKLLAALPSPTLYVGDGVNDTLSLAAADVGIAPIQANEAAREGAAAQLLTPGVEGVVRLLALAKRTRRVMVQNLVLSALYNTLALGVVVVMAIPPLVAVLAMAASSLSVTLNSARLMWHEPDSRV
ncbi:heavy metal translocating P-type ATPase [Vreelandella olivaria]|uniref:heavy metal translocating P-type ATPase n=1 Tax=Vreelandella olivaria TaxID=390919 RepID=UPI00201F50D8|nr:cation-translocating P-type ATPase [Halomonas olivaria]